MSGKIPFMRDRAIVVTMEKPTLKKKRDTE
jgi:hypothetical protein